MPRVVVFFKRQLSFSCIARRGSQQSSLAFSLLSQTRNFPDSPVASPSPGMALSPRLVAVRSVRRRAPLRRTSGRSEKMSRNRD